MDDPPRQRGGPIRLWFIHLLKALIDGAASDIAKLSHLTHSNKPAATCVMDLHTRTDVSKPGTKVSPIQ